LRKPLRRCVRRRPDAQVKPARCRPYRPYRVPTRLILRSMPRKALDKELSELITDGRHQPYELPLYGPIITRAVETVGILLSSLCICRGRGPHQSSSKVSLPLSCLSSRFASPNGFRTLLHSIIPTICPGGGTRWPRHYRMCLTFYAFVAEG
jgi:hypothetical protein